MRLRSVVDCGELLRVAGVSYGDFSEGVCVTAKDYRRIALSLPEAFESSHPGHPDFRVGGKIFCTLAYEKEGFGVLMLSPEEQAAFVEDAPEVFSPVPGGLGPWRSNPCTAGCNQRGCAGRGVEDSLESAFGEAKDEALALTVRVGYAMLRG